MPASLYIVQYIYIHKSGRTPIRIHTYVIEARGIPLGRKKEGFCLCEPLLRGKKERKKETLRWLISGALACSHAGLLSMRILWNVHTCSGK